MNEPRDPQTSPFTEEPGGPSGTSAGPPPSPPPPTGPPAIRLFAPLVVGVVALTLGIVFSGPAKAHLGNLWHALVGEHEEEATGDYYTCGMHPWVILPKPGTCPICQMDLTPLDPAKFSGKVTIDPVVAQNIGVRIAPVEKGPLNMTVRTVGTVAYDETRVRDINTKVSGFIEKLHVDYLGAPVKVGDPLFEVYSPQLYAAQEEYLIAARGGGSDLEDSARMRLRYFDISDAQIDALRKRGEATKTMTIESPYEGLVVEKMATEGMSINPGMKLYRIADLSKVWVMVSLFEGQLPYVKVGERAVMTLPYVPGREFDGRVAYIYPTLDKKTRQVMVRLELDNPTLELKPGMFGTVRLESTLEGERTLVARQAILDTGERQVAFVSTGDGHFEPRQVVLGIETEGGKVEVRSGLEPGEMVVVSGQFLLDSEAKVREALARMIRGDMASEQKPVAVVAGVSEVTKLPADAERELSKVLDASILIGDTLADDSTKGVSENAEILRRSIEALKSTKIEGNPHFWHQHGEAGTIAETASAVAKATDIDEARRQYAELSAALSTLVRATGVPPSYGKEIQELHCPMYRKEVGGTTWLQAAGGAKNPYYGSSMLECFDERKAMPVTGAQTQTKD